MQATWIADVLRDAGCTVIEYDGWKTRGHGDFTNLTHLVWHHDASPKGDSPGVPRSMLARWDTAAAQLWVDRKGVWHVLAAGVAYHAGAVLSGKPGNRQSLGIETDHTSGEEWPEALLHSLRNGSKALLTRMGRTAANGLEFHRTICSPAGRKVDPDGLDLATERRAVDSASSNPLKALSLGDRVLGEGDEGPDVVQLQGLFAGLKADGDFGEQTRKVVEDFQAANGLKVDGLVGPTTLAAIRAKNADPMARMKGVFREHWNTLSDTVRAGLGKPLNDATLSGDGVGQFQHFENGSMYWSPASHVHLVYGGIRDAWAKLGWERGEMGYPLTDETDGLAGRIQTFQGGILEWNAVSEQVWLHRYIIG